MGRANETAVRSTPGIGWAMVELLRNRAATMREAAESLNPVAADAYERRACQLDRGVMLVEAAMRKESRSDVA